VLNPTPTPFTSNSSRMLSRSVVDLASRSADFTRVVSPAVSTTTDPDNTGNSGPNNV